MKTFRNKKGFTLIELLAVIVVLAIVMVLATTTVLPLMTSARRNAFVLEANNARDTASNIMSLLSFNPTVEGLGNPGTNDYRVNAAKTKYCFTLKTLANTGYYDKDIKAFEGTSPEYEGKVIVEVDSSNSNKYTYKVKMHNANLYVSTLDGTGGAVVDGDVETYGSQTGYTCTTGDVGE